MTGTPKVNILLVDDQPQKLLTYEAILGSLGENLLRAHSAHDALAILLKQEVAVILVDVVMPEMDGFEFARLIREHPRFKNVPMIFVTAISTSDLELVRGYSLGAVDYVCVPVVPEILRAKVSIFVELHRKTRDLLALNYTLEQRVADRTQEVEHTLRIVERNARRLEQEMNERRLADERLRQRAEEMETLLETLPIGVFIAHDAASRRITGNRIGCEMLRMPLDSNISKSAPEDERPNHFQIHRGGREIPNDELPVQIAARGTPVPSTELDLVFSDGTVTHNIISATPLFDHQGDARGAVAAVLDITDRKRAEQALVDADNRKDEFLATLAHELRNPLAPLANALELMRTSSLDENEQTQLREIMNRQVNQLRRLVDDLMDVARITRNRIELRRSPTDLRTIIDGALESSRPMIESAGHQIQLVVPAEPVWSHVDRVRMTQVVSNLLNNAAKYTEHGGQIRVTCATLGEQAEIQVCDSGIGISTEALPTIFDMFARADTSLTRDRDGLGVGLTLVKKLVELHGGSVEANSAGLGQGSDFVVRLQLCEPVAPPEQTPDSAETSPEAPRRYRVLVVDDQRSSAHMVSRMLTTLGQDVDTAYDGASALSTIEQHPPDIVISDIGMPRMNGYELARHIRTCTGGDEIRLVALTGYGQEQNRSEARQAGFDEHLVKPVSLADLRGLLDRIHTLRT